NGADDERSQDADRHIPLGVLGLLGRSRYGIKPDEGEEHHTSRSQDAHDAAICMLDALGVYELGGGGNVGCVIGRVHESPADHDDHYDDGDLGDDDKAVDECRLLRPADQQEGQYQQNSNGGNIHDPVHAGVRSHADLKWRMAPLVGHMKTRFDEVKDLVEILTPGNGYSSRADGIFQYQIPANDPGNQFAHGCIGVGVGAACDGSHGGEFGV